MSGIQISGLLANQAFDWKSVVDQLIAADSIPVTQLQTQQATNSSKVAALGKLNTDLQNLQTSIQSFRAGNLFSSRIVSSDVANTTWSSTSSQGAALGTYAINVTQLASQATIKGATAAGSVLNATNNVSGLTIANMRTASAVTAGTFTVNGQLVTIATTDSLQAVFDAIHTATGNDVTATYNATTDKVSLTSAGGNPIVLGAANDTSNFLSVFKLYNSGTASITSSSTLGTVSTGSTLASAGLNTALSGQDGSGNGAFTVNGVSISYNTGTDTISTILAKINNSSAGVTANYDNANNQFSIINTATGDTGIGVSDTTGNLMAAMKLTSAAGNTFVRGTNALYTINGGPVLSSMSNTLTPASHGITGLSVIVNSKMQQTLTVQSDAGSMQSAIQDFITKFNTLQTDINSNTAISNNGTTVTPSILSGNREVQDWGSSLQSLAFASIPGISQTVTKLDDLGIDFNGTSLDGNLTIYDATKLANALTQRPQDVEKFFLSGSTGFVNKIYTYLTTAMSSDSSQQSVIGAANQKLSDQITTLQSRLAVERTNLTNSFMAMLDAQSKAQSASTTLTQQFFNNNSSSCWVARAVYGESNPLWLFFRYWLFTRAPGWFRWAYLRYGEGIANWLADKPLLRSAIRRWMDARIRSLFPSTANSPLDLAV